MVNRKIIDEWLDKADEDFNFASKSLKVQKKEFFAPICFHFQQAAEKYLKAFIVAKELDFRKTHDLVALLKICAEKEPDFQKIKGECLFLNDLYVEPRYPFGEFREYSLEETKLAKESAEKIGNFVKKYLNTPL